MKNLLVHRTRHALAIFVSLSLFAGLPLAPEVYGADLVKKVKVKDHKVKVKAVGGKAKIKHKANGTQKIKAKGPNGDLAAGIAYDNAGYPTYGSGFCDK